MVETSLQLLTRLARDNWPLCTVVVSEAEVRITTQNGIMMLITPGVSGVKPLVVALRALKETP